MLQSVVIGHLGADAEVKNSNGKEFTVFRVAHTSKWRDDAAQAHEELIWVDCVMTGRPPVVEFLKKGQQVYVGGSTALRVYSSQKDRCMKAGITINVRQLEMLGGKPDEVPTRLYRTDNNAEVSVSKLYWSAELEADENVQGALELVSSSQKRFVTDKNGFIMPVKNELNEAAE